MTLEDVVAWAPRAIEVAGIAVIVVGAVGATLGFARHLRRGASLAQGYRLYRQGLGRAILLGLEFLVAADIIRTVAISPTFTSVGILAAIVLIRTFLSFSLELEIEGRWPWQSGRSSGGRAGERPAAGGIDASDWT